MHRVADIMTKDVVSCHMYDSLNTAARLMWEHDCGCVPVVDDLRRVTGMITDRDISMAAYIQGKSLKDILVQSVCSSTVQTCSKDHSLARAEEIMVQAQVRRLPVVEEDGTLAGILSLSDLAHHLTFVAPGKSSSLGPRNLSTVLEAVSRPRPAAARAQASQSHAVVLG